MRIAIECCHSERPVTSSFPNWTPGNQIIQQTSFTVPPGTSLREIIRRGQEDNEPRCLVDGIRRVVLREVQLHFHRVIVRTR